MTWSSFLEGHNGEKTAQHQARRRAPRDGDHDLHRSAPQPKLTWNPLLGLQDRSLLPIWISQKLTVSRARLKILQAPPQGQHQSAGLTGVGGTAERLKEDGHPPPPSTVCTSRGFLRLLRSLAILAFLSCFRFFSSRSLSPSLLEELAEALLSNLSRTAGLRERGEPPTSLGREDSEPQDPRPGSRDGAGTVNKYCV